MPHADRVLLALLFISSGTKGALAQTNDDRRRRRGGIFGFMGAARWCLPTWARRTGRQSGVGIANMGVITTRARDKNPPVASAGVLGIYGLIIAVIISLYHSDWVHVVQGLAAVLRQRAACLA